MINQKIRILIVDDHAMIRLGLVGALSSEPDMEVVGQAKNAREAMELHQKLSPDVTLMDGILPDMHGVEATRAIVQYDSLAKVILISINETAEDVSRALDAGARGYVPKSCEQETIIEAIHTVALGKEFLPAHLVRRLAERKSIIGLSQREVEVMRLIANGLLNKQIAVELALSENTVKTHIARIMSKLGVHDRTSIAMKAVTLGLLY